MWPQTQVNQSLEPDLAALDSLLERRLCTGLEASSGKLWTLPSPGIPDIVLRNHVDDEMSRTLYAFLGSRIFSQSMPPTIAQTFASYPTNVRTIIEAQMNKTTVLSRISSRLPLYAHKVSPIIPTPENFLLSKVQLLHAAVLVLSEQHGGDHAAEWLKTLVGNLVPIIMDTVADWEDLGLSSDVEGGHGRAVLDEHEPSDSTIINHVEGRSKPEFLELDDDDPDNLAKLLESHLLGLDPLDEDF